MGFHFWGVGPIRMATIGGSMTSCSTVTLHLQARSDYGRLLPRCSKMPSTFPLHCNGPGQQYKKSLRGCPYSSVVRQYYATVEILLFITNRRWWGIIHVPLQAFRHYAHV